jgi:hypothetical protein
MSVLDVLLIVTTLALALLALWQRVLIREDDAVIKSYAAARERQQDVVNRLVTQNAEAIAARDVAVRDLARARYQATGARIAKTGAKLT